MAFNNRYPLHQLVLDAFVRIHQSFENVLLLTFGWNRWTVAYLAGNCIVDGVVPPGECSLGRGLPMVEKSLDFSVAKLV